MEPAALPDKESDFAVLYRRAIEEGAAGIELAGAMSGNHSSAVAS
jgi:hypothetical protein